jgi:hypothetical protein
MSLNLKQEPVKAHKKACDDFLNMFKEMVLKTFSIVLFCYCLSTLLSDCVL